MATRGRKPKPPFLKLVTGNPGKRPIKSDPAPGGNGNSGPIDPPVRLSGRQLVLWNQFVRTASWLAPHDAPAALVWVSLYHEFEINPAGMVAGKIAQLRAAASEIGVGGPGSRARFGADGGNKEEDSAASYFG
ncbi:MAG: hypothetical protein H0W39_01090 [Sphingomonas sp.]|nr:hypothetical protein [Sphingomonas sp.]